MTVAYHGAKKLPHCSCGQIQFIFLQRLIVRTRCWQWRLVPPPAHAVDQGWTCADCPCLGSPVAEIWECLYLPLPESAHSLCSAFAVRSGGSAEEDYGLLWSASRAMASQLGSGADPAPGLTLIPALPLAFDVMCSCISCSAAEAWLGALSAGSSCEGRLMR